MTDPDRLPRPSIPLQTLGTAVPGSGSERQDELIRLATADLKPIVPDGLRRRVVNLVVQAIMSTTAGTKIDRSKLENLIESSFGSLFDGKRFDVQPVLQALLRVPSMNESDLFVGLVNAKVLLETMGCEMNEPQLALEAPIKAQLLREAEAAADRARVEYKESKARTKSGTGKRLKLGDLLVTESRITQQELDEALGFQARFGGKLGTNLVQLGMITEEALAKFLGMQLEAPCCLSEREINAIPPEVVSVLPAEIAERHQVLPIGLDKHRLRLLMKDPTDVDVIDDVGFRTGRGIAPVVAPELLISYGLEKHYGIRRQPRLLTAERQTAGVVMGDGAAGLDLPAHSIRSGLRAILPPLPEASRPEPQKKKAPFDLPAFARRLVDAEGEADVFTVALDHFGRQFGRVAIFLLDGETARGWMKRDPEGTVGLLRRTKISLVSGGTMSSASSSRRASFAWLAGVREDLELATALELQPGAPVLCLPVGASRVTAFIVAAELRPDQAPPDAQLLEQAAGLVGTGLEIARLRRQMLEGSGAS